MTERALLSERGRDRQFKVGYAVTIGSLGPLDRSTDGWYTGRTTRPGRLSTAWMHQSRPEIPLNHALALLSGPVRLV